MADENFREDLHNFLYESEKIIYLLAIDQLTANIFFFEFDFNGYSIQLWPGSYSFYAFIINPLADNTIGIGYPMLNGAHQDPNPVLFHEEGLFEMNFIIFDTEDYVDYYIV